MPENRPDPQALLHALAKKSTSRGRLKIFFGYAAGVGKTFAMLEAAHAAKQAGIDVVCGYIEPHTRPETMALAQGLAALPPMRVEHKSIVLSELDLDAALARHPQLLLVDELAHTNSEGCRHRKRYQDIEELLTAGIDVYTTVNVQHIESLNDLVASITGVTVRERVPDSVFDTAQQVEVVDIEPDDLIDRLGKGKIYKEKQAQKALDHFFTKDNLEALREI
ncbi:MAG: histidine kinase, partial [Ruthenibacterium sp.]